MDQTKDELLGSLFGAVKIVCGSRIVKRVRNSVKAISRKEHNLQINNHQGGNINFYITDVTKEEIAQLFMDNHGSFKIE